MVLVVATHPKVVRVVPRRTMAAPTIMMVRAQVSREMNKRECDADCH
jgi:hypothetical protein